MKLSLKPAALAVAVTLASAAAHAQLAPPAYATTAPNPASNNSLILAIWDPSTGNSTSGHGEQVNLSYVYSQLTQASGALTPDTQTGSFTTAINPATGSGSVLQLDFGVVPQFAATFGSGSTASYMVVAGVGSAQNAAEVTSATPLNTTNLPAGGLAGLAQNLQGQAWSGTGGFTVDLTGSAANNPLAGSYGGGTMTGHNYSGAVNTALNFYNAIPGSGRGTDIVTQYTNALGAGFWFLSSAGDLTWNVLASTVPNVPLPAAVWLLVSGLAGLGAIGRRRLAVA